MVFLLELSVDVADHVVSEVVTDVEILDLAKFVQLLKDILVEIFEMFLDLLRIDRLTLSVDPWGYYVRTVVHVREKKSRRDCGAIVDP